MANKDNKKANKSSSKQSIPTNSIVSTKAVVDKVDDSQGTISTTNASTTAPRGNSSTVREDRDNTGFGVVLVTILILLTIWAIVSLSNSGGNTDTIGTLDYAGSVRVGSATPISYTVGQYPIEQGASVEWYIDDVRVNSTQYRGGNIDYEWVPTKVGRHTVKLKVGNTFSDTAVLTIGRPLVTLDIPDVTIQYGQPIPQIDYEVNGLIDGDTLDMLGCQGTVQCQGVDGVGIYELSMTNHHYTNDKYEVQFDTGNLVVTPKPLKITNTVTRQYDGTNIANIDNIMLSGVIEGDKVRAKSDKLHFDNKNVGTNKCISTSTIQLVGEDASNYCISDAYIQGNITAKPLTIEGISIEGKVYDGNTNATITSNGTLVGVVDGDMVAVGSMNAHYKDTKVGRVKPVCVDDIVLIGTDKDNYSIESCETQSSIVKKYLDLLTNNPLAVEGSR